MSSIGIKLIKFARSDMADRVALLPSAQRLDGRRITFSATNMLAAYSAFQDAEIDRKRIMQ